jgi:hypothetical protein
MGEMSPGQASTTRHFVKRLNKLKDMTMYLFILYATAPAAPQLGPWADLLWSETLADLPAERVQAEAFSFMRGILRPAGTELHCVVRGPYPMRAIPVAMETDWPAGTTTVPSKPAILWRAWAGQITLTGVGVLAVEAILWWFR